MHPSLSNEESVRSDTRVREEAREPMSCSQRTNTRHYPTFSVVSSPFLLSVLSQAQDRFSLGMSQAIAKELVADVNTFLFTPAF